MPLSSGHDSAMTDLEVPNAMLFVPSKNGISHSPDEFTSKEQVCENFIWFCLFDATAADTYNSGDGVQVLLQVVLEYDEHVFHQLSLADCTLVKDIEVITPSDLEEIMDWNKATTPRVLNMTVNELFKRTRTMKPDSLAIDAWDGALTYAELDRLSSKFAAKLCQMEYISLFSSSLML
jgi:hypothetical protein